MRYRPLEEQAADLIARGRDAWQALQHLAMAEDDLFDSLILLGQELWLPHHETDESACRVTLRVAARYPEAGCGALEARAREHCAALEARWTDARGSLRIALEPR